MKNKKQIIIIGSFVLAGILVWFWLKPTTKKNETELKGATAGIQYLNFSDRITKAIAR